MIKIQEKTSNPTLDPLIAKLERLGFKKDPRAISKDYSCYEWRLKDPYDIYFSISIDLYSYGGIDFYIDTWKNNDTLPEEYVLLVSYFYDKYVKNAGLSKKPELKMLYSEVYRIWHDSKNNHSLPLSDFPALFKIVNEFINKINLLNRNASAVMAALKGKKPSQTARVNLKRR